MKVKLTEEELKARKKARNAKWQANNPEIAKALHAKWQADNPEKVKARNAKWQANNPEKSRAYSAKWRADNPEKVKAYSARFKMCRGTNLRPSDIPQELIDLKRKQIQMKQVMYANSK